MVTKKKSLKVYIDLDDAEKLEQIAQTEQRSVTGLIRLAVRDFLAARDTNRK